MTHRCRDSGGAAGLTVLSHRHPKGNPDGPRQQFYVCTPEAALPALKHYKSARKSISSEKTDGLVERFNRTLKTMLQKFTASHSVDWDKSLSYLLFAYREVPQASTGF